MYGNPCLHAACKSMFCELLWFRVVVLLGEFGQRLDRLLAALIILEQCGATQNESCIRMLLKDMVGPWGLEPQTSTVSR